MEEKLKFVDPVHTSKISEESLKQILEILNVDYPDAVMTKNDEYYCNLTRIPAYVWEKIRNINME